MNWLDIAQSVLAFVNLLGWVDSLFSAVVSLAVWALHHPAAFIAGDTLFTWVFYLAMCSLKRAYDADKIPKPLLPVAWALLGMFLVADAVFNVVVGTAIFWQLPSTLLFTKRCKQNKLRADWRATEARWWCSNVLNPFDPSGVHC